MKAAARANGWHDDGLGHYLRSIRRYDMLSLEDEQSLARRWRDNKDSDAADKLVTSHLRLVVKIAMGYRGYGLPLADLVAEGNVGMVRALDRFDPDRGFRLATYAMWWIRAAINEYVVRSRSLVKIGTTAAQKKLFFNLSVPSKNGGLSEREVCDSPKFGNKRRIAWPGPLSPAWIMTAVGYAIQAI